MHKASRSYQRNWMLRNGSNAEQETKYMLLPAYVVICAGRLQRVATTPRCRIYGSDTGQSRTMSERHQLQKPTCRRYDPNMSDVHHLNSNSFVFFYTRTQS